MKQNPRASGGQKGGEEIAPHRTRRRGLDTVTSKVNSPERIGEKSEIWELGFAEKGER